MSQSKKARCQKCSPSDPCGSLETLCSGRVSGLDWETDITVVIPILFPPSGCVSSPSH